MPLTRRLPLRSTRGLVSLREIRKYRKSDCLVIPKAPFRRMCTEVVQSKECACHLGEDAMEALQQAAESFLEGLFKDTHLCALHVKRETIRIEDMRLCRSLRGRDYAGAFGAGLGLDGCEGAKPTSIRVGFGSMNPYT